MALKVTFLSAPFAGRSLEFDDTLGEIRFGRAMDCEVQFPEDLTLVGRNHFFLRREMGAYKFAVQKARPVFLNGKPVLDGQELPRNAEIQISTTDGPRLRLERQDAAGSNLAPTQIFNEGQDISDVLAANEGRDRRQSLTLAVITLVLLVVAGAGTLIWQAMQTDVAAVGAQVGNVAQKVDEIGQRVVEVSNQLPELRQRVETIDKATLDAAAIVAARKDSVYQVQVQKASGTREGQGSASVVQLPDGTLALATNAHVAELFNEIATNPEYQGGALVVVPPKAPFTPVKVKAIKLHPAYKPFINFMNAQADQNAAWSGAGVNLIQGYDVALLYVEDPSQLGPPLPYAPPGTLAAMRAGDPVMFIGYPTEKLDSIDPAKPEPVSQAGRVTSMTDFFFETAAPQDNVLIQHSVPITGGASGSPMFNAKGEVIGFINAMSIDVETDAQGNYAGRSPLAAMINFGQRADLLTELAADRADAQTAAREAAMAAKLAEWQKPAQAFFEDIKLTMAREAGGADKLVTLLDQQTFAMDTPWPPAEGKRIMTFNMTFQKPGGYVLMAASKDRRLIRLLYVKEEGGETKVWYSSPGLAPNALMGITIKPEDNPPFTVTGVVLDVSDTGAGPAGQIDMMAIYQPPAE